MSTFPIIEGTPYGSKGYLRGVDPQSDEHMERVGFRVGFVDFNEHTSTLRGCIIGKCWSASVWRGWDMRKNEDWHLESIALPGYHSGYGGPPVADSAKALPSYSLWREALDVSTIGDMHGCTPDDYKQMLADAIQAEGERLYASSYGLGL